MRDRHLSSRRRRSGPRRNPDARWVRAALTASLVLSTASPSPAEIVIEGRVALPPARVAAIAPRYQKIAGKVAEPEPPAAIVYLDGSFAPQNATRPGPAEVAQKGYQFAPGLLAVEVGDYVEFPNRDDEYHHVFSYSKAHSFDLGRYRKDEEVPKVLFDAPGVVTLGCEIHDHMRGTILVLETPYFAKTNEAGDYRIVIPEPLSGTFRLKAWISLRQTLEQSVELHDGVAVKADFTGS